MNWNKFLNLVKKTGDRLIVTDKDEGEAYIIMSLGEYEDMINKIGSPNVEPMVAAQPSDEAFSEEQGVEPGNIGYTEPKIEEQGLSEEERFYLEPIE